MSRQPAILAITALLVAAPLYAQQGAQGAAGSRTAAPAGTSARPAAPAAGAAIPDAALPVDYVVGAEDVLGVLFWREQDMSGDVTVRPDGRITLPLIGEMTAAGLTPDALRTQIQEAATKYLADPNVSLVVRQINSRRAYITGEVASPGAYPLTGPRSVMQLIALAGGLNEYAKSEEITIMRQGRDGKTTALKFNYKDVSRGRRLEQNVLLQPGDTVIVP